MPLSACWPEGGGRCSHCGADFLVHRGTQLYNPYEIRGLYPSHAFAPVVKPATTDGGFRQIPWWLPHQHVPYFAWQIPSLWMASIGVCRNPARLLPLAVRRGCCSARIGVPAVPRTPHRPGWCWLSAGLPLRHAGWRAGGGSCIASTIRSSRSSHGIWSLPLLCLSLLWRSVCLGGQMRCARCFGHVRLR